MGFFSKIKNVAESAAKIAQKPIEGAKIAADIASQAIGNDLEKMGNPQKEIVNKIEELTGLGRENQPPVGIPGVPISSLEKQK